jgi:toxin ParE1/3/4
MATVKLSALAQADLEEIHSYIAEDNQEIADRLIDEFVAKFQLLAHNSALGSMRNELVQDLRGFPHRRYIIFYFPTESGIEVYRVLHGSRDIGEHFNHYTETLPPALEE